METRPILKSTLRAVFAVAVLVGAFYRYARTLPLAPGWFGVVPWTLLLLLGVVACALLLVEMPSLGKLDLIMIFLTGLLVLTYFISSWRHGFADQLPFGGDFLLPLPVYFAVRWDRRFTVKSLETLLIPFSLIAASLSIIEFYTVNFGQPIFNFGGYWNDVGNVGYHASAVHYALLGFRNRPWGVLALPEASGTLMAALALYFAASRKSPVRLFCLAICLGAAYASGSRTAVLTVGVFGLVLVWQSALPRFLKVIAIVSASAAAAGEMAALTRFYAPQVELHGFVGKTAANFWNVVSPAHPVAFILRCFIGNGILSVNNPMPNMTGEVALLNWATYVGLLAWLLMFLVFLSTLLRYRRLRHADPAAAQRVRASYILLLALAFGSLHYDAISRYPANLIAMAIIALVMRPDPVGRGQVGWASTAMTAMAPACVAQ